MSHRTGNTPVTISPVSPWRAGPTKPTSAFDRYMYSIAVKKRTGSIHAALFVCDTQHGNNTPSKMQK